MPISQLASDVQAGKISSISVNGDEATITYNDSAHTQKIAKKEPDASLSQTLYNLGVPAAALNKVSITIAAQNEWYVWAENVIPFLAPLLLIGFFVWYLSRQ